MEEYLMHGASVYADKCSQSIIALGDGPWNGPAENCAFTPISVRNGAVALEPPRPVS
jgi:hypothetical protein